MQKNWYIAYTKPKCEKKAAALLTKRKIENFCPLTSKQISTAKKSKLLYEPLFDSYVFACLPESELGQLKHIDSVVSVVYWKGQPAFIKDSEINAIKEFIQNHQNIRLERSEVNLNDEAKIIDGPSYSIDGKVLTVKNKSIKVNLPSLGFIMVAEMETETIIGREISFGNKELLLQ